MWVDDVARDERSGQQLVPFVFSFSRVFPATDHRFWSVAGCIIEEFRWTTSGRRQVGRGTVSGIR